MVVWVCVRVWELGDRKARAGVCVCVYMCDSEGPWVVGVNGEEVWVCLCLCACVWAVFVCTGD